MTSVHAPGTAIISDDWLRPVGNDPTAPVAWTRLGTLDGIGEPIVDPNGVVQVAPGLPGIAWWIAGDDRWYFPSRERTVRQSLLHNTPVVETRMRVKGGDVCHRSYAATVTAPSGLRDVVVIEVENATGVPCGVTFAVRPFGVFGDTPIHQIAISSGTVTADGHPVLVLPRDPAAALAGNRIGGDLVERVARGEATAPTFEPVSCPDGRAQAVTVVPLAHRNSFRVVLPIPDGDGTFDAAAMDFPVAEPPSDNVVRGWRAQVRQGARMTVPDPRLQAVCDAAGPWLLATTNHRRAAVGCSVWNGDAAPRWHHVAAAAGALDRLGFGDRAGLLLARAAAAHQASPEGDAGTLLEAFDAHLARTGDVAFAKAVAESSIGIVSSLGAKRRGAQVTTDPRGALEAAARVFEIAGERVAARSTRRTIPRVGVTDGSPGVDDRCVEIDRCLEIDRVRRRIETGGGAAAWGLLDRHLDDVASTGIWSADYQGGSDPHCVGMTGAVTMLICDLLANADAGHLRLLAFAPDAWIGASLGVERIATPVGRVGYAVRWHGDRPAVLWELAHRDGFGPDSVDPDVTAPGLDAAWHGTGWSGEALLAERERPVEESAGGSRISGLQIGRSRGGR